MRRRAEERSIFSLNLHLARSLARVYRRGRGASEQRLQTLWHLFSSLLTACRVGPRALSRNRHDVLHVLRLINIRENPFNWVIKRLRQHRQQHQRRIFHCRGFKRRRRRRPFSFPPCYLRLLYAYGKIKPRIVEAIGTCRPGEKRPRGSRNYEETFPSLGGEKKKQEKHKIFPREVYFMHEVEIFLEMMDGAGSSAIDGN